MKRCINGIVNLENTHALTPLSHNFKSIAAAMSTNLQDIAAPYEEKLKDEMIEDIAVKQEDHAIAILPESLWGMSEEERNALERNIVRKMDLIVL